MPSYDYKCLNCGFIEEKFHYISETPIYYCSKCKNIMAKQIGKGGGIIFKGKGFYQTDYKKKESEDE